MVASTDWPEVTNYRAIVSAQPHRDEIIKDLYKSHNSEKGLVHGGMIRLGVLTCNYDPSFQSNNYFSNACFVSL